MVGWCQLGAEHVHAVCSVQLRFKVNALGQAFTRRSDEQRDSMRAHQISLGAFALQNALAHGKPYADAASLLAQTCAKEDEVVAAALQALPQDSASRVRLAVHAAVHWVVALWQPLTFFCKNMAVL